MIIPPDDFDKSIRDTSRGQGRRIIIALIILIVLVAFGVKLVHGQQLH